MLDEMHIRRMFDERVARHRNLLQKVRDNEQRPPLELTEIEAEVGVLSLVLQVPSPIGNVRDRTDTMWVCRSCGNRNSRIDTRCGKCRRDRA